MSERSIVYMPLADMQPADINPKKHAGEDLAVSFDEHGYAEPVLVDERTGRLVAGHGRLDALIARHAAGGVAPDGVRVDETGGWSIPVVRGWASRDDAQASRYLVASNRLTEKGGWDDSALADLLGELSRTDTLLGTGFDDSELAALLASLEGKSPASLSDPDDVPDAPAEPVTKRGDLWLLGDHRLLCGDATDKDDLVRLMGEAKAGMLWTDPPYGVSYAAKNGYLNAIARGNHIQIPIENDHMKPQEMSELWDAAFGNIRGFMALGASYYVTGPQGGDLLLLLSSLRDSGFPLRHMLIWAKNQFVLGRSDYNYQHEPLIFGWVDGSHTFLGGGGESSVWQIDKPYSSRLHPTMKPVELVARSIRNSLPTGGSVLDPFCGSGTTIIAAHQEGRVAFGCELDESYVDVICRRFQEHTGVVPILESSGEPVSFVGEQ